MSDKGALIGCQKHLERSELPPLVLHLGVVASKSRGVLKGDNVDK